MNDYDKILEIARMNQNVFKTKMIVEAGIRKERIRELLERGEIQKIGPGFYCIYGETVNPYYEIQRRVPKAVFSYETAAYLWVMTKEIPDCFACTVPRGYNTSKLQLNQNVKYHYVLQDLYEEGLTILKTAEGYEIVLYDRERTVCDFIRHRRRISPEVYSEVLNSYFKSRDKDIRKLAKYGRLFHIAKELDLYIEVL